jgi:hypothetical protein
VRGPGRGLLIAVVSLAAALSLATTPAQASSTRRVLLVLIPTGRAPTASATLDREFNAQRGLDSLGLLDASLGPYDQVQTLLDITQAARVPSGDYAPITPPALHPTTTGTVAGWQTALSRARGPDASIEPGLLASSVPGGVAYVTAARTPGPDGLLATARDGRIAAVSIGPPASLTQRVSALSRRYRLVVAALSPSPLASSELARLLAARPASELVLALAQPPPTPPGAQQPALLLAAGASGLSGQRHGALATATTRIDGLVTTLDLAPTILRWLHVRRPSAFIGQPITVGGRQSAHVLETFAQRIAAIESRRQPALLYFAAAWLALALLASAVFRGAATRTALRLGGLAALWVPSVVLIPATLAAPSESLELAICLAGAFALALITDRLAPWPRGPLLPALSMLVLYTVDLARGSPLIVRSLLGPNPLVGGRFFGIGNVLEALAPVVLFAGIAALLPQRAATRRDVATFAAGGWLLTAIFAWGRLGADVGALFTIGGGTAVGAVLLLPGKLGMRRVLLVAAVPLTGLVLLAVLDLASGGGAQYTQVVLHAHSVGAVAATLRRRLDEALATFAVASNAIASAVCLITAAAIVRYRARVLSAVIPGNAWGAALGGGFAGSLFGSIANDSGARLLLVGSATLACVLAYLRGTPSSPSERASRRARNVPTLSFLMLRLLSGRTLAVGPASPGRARPLRRERTDAKMVDDA